MVVLLIMTNTSHKTKVKDLANFEISKTEFQNYKQSLITERLVLGNTDGLNRESFTCILKQSLEKARKTFLNQSGWAQYGVSPFDLAPVWLVRKEDIEAAAAALAVAEPLAFPTKLSAPLTYLNANSIDALTTTL